MIVFIFVEQIESGTHERNCYNNVECRAGWLHCVCVALISGLYYIWTYNNICKCCKMQMFKIIIIHSRHNLNGLHLNMH